MINVIRENKFRAIFSSVVILLPMFIGTFLWNELPERMAIHWGFDGNADGFGTSVLIVFVMPALSLLFHWICIVISYMDKKMKEQNRKITGLMWWIVPFISTFSSVMIYASAFGKKLGIGTLIWFPMAILFAVIGNYLPKCKQNVVFGIKVKYALENEDNWNATHRFGGKVWFYGGLLMAFTIFLPDEVAAAVCIALMIIMIILPCGYSHWYHKKQVETGTSASGTSVEISKNMKNVGNCAAVIAVIITVLSIILLFIGDIDIKCGEKSLTVDAGYCWKSITVAYDDIESIEYRTEDDAGMRTNGYGTPKLSLGNFENEEFGAYIRYSYTDKNDCIVMKVKGKVIVIGAETAEETKKIYDNLTEKIS